MGTIMKKFIQAVSGKKAMYVTLILVSICAVLDVLTSVRLGTKPDFTPITVIYCVIAAWAVCLFD